jgi:hypothetical protein
MVVATFVVVSTVVGCPIVDARDAIGKACTLDGPCAADHFCLLDAPAVDGAGSGVCAPVRNYGGCPSPTWPVRVEGALTGDRVVNDAAGLQALDGVRRVQGALRLQPAEVLGAAVVGDLCPLAGLQRVDDGLNVRNTDVTTLDGLQALAFAGAGVTIVDNASLVDVAGLLDLQHSVLPEGGNVGVLIAANRQLDPAKVEELRAALEPAGVVVAGCGNRGELDCDGVFAPILTGARRR